MQTATNADPTATAILTPNRTVEDIAADLMAAKSMKKEAEKLVRECEEELIKVLGAKEEGSKTHCLNGYKVTIEGVINRKVDWEAFDAVVKELERREATFVPPIKMKRELDEPYFKRLFKDQPGIYAMLAKGVTATPGKTAVTVVKTED